MDSAVAIDIGGTKISWALVNSDYKIIWRRQMETPPSAPELISALDHIVEESLDTSESVAGVGIGIAGLVDYATATVVAAPNLPLSREPLKQHLQTKFNLDCRLDNDANLAILGELCCGAGKRLKNFFGLTVGTGIGGGIVIDGQLWRGSKGTAAELGHIVVDAGGPQCACGNRGCLETKASGTAIERLAKEIVATKPNSPLGQIFSGDPDTVTGPVVAEAAKSGDTEAVSVLSEAGRWLGIGIGSLINVFDPELVVLGGGVASSIDLMMDSIHREIEQAAIDPRAKQIPIAISKLENDAGLLGAAGMIFQTAAKGFFQ